jgi:hypothetical protein
MWKRLVVVAVVAALTAMAVAVVVAQVDTAQNTLPSSLQSAIPMRLALVGLAALAGLGVDLRAVIQLLQSAVQLLHPAAARAGVLSLLALREALALMVTWTSPVAVEDLETTILRGALGVIPSLAVVRQGSRTAMASQAHQAVGDLAAVAVAPAGPAALAALV